MESQHLLRSLSITDYGSSFLCLLQLDSVYDLLLHLLTMALLVQVGLAKLFGPIVDRLKLCARSLISLI